MPDSHGQSVKMTLFAEQVGSTAGRRVPSGVAVTPLLSHPSLPSPARDSPLTPAPVSLESLPLSLPSWGSPLTPTCITHSVCPGPQSLKCLLSGPLQHKFGGTCSRSIHSVSRRKFRGKGAPREHFLTTRMEAGGFESPVLSSVSDLVFNK